MRGRWEAAFWKDALDFLQVRNWKAKAKEREDWKEVIGKAMARKRPEAPGNTKKKTKEKNIIMYNTVYHFTQLTSAVEKLPCSIVKIYDKPKPLNAGQ